MPQHKVFLFGLDFAGKTTIMNFIKEEPETNTQPTISFVIDNLIIKNTEFIIWDAPGQINYREKWGRGVLDAVILLFVLDTADAERFIEAKEELYKVLNDYDTRRISLLFCFHKIDLEAAQNNYEKAQEIFELKKILERDVYQLRTSIKATESIEAIKNFLVEIIEKGRW